ncbi:MAG: T9SS type A sorting domain-containing protein [Chitinophagales bacterium]|nr:T9SS type A sorting domain-containing protein [Chitinophagales bacterium]MBP9795511.1 T9SS type A sorting domain-containing protein [Chitinophagales bacterium]
MITLKGFVVVGIACLSVFTRLSAQTGEKPYSITLEEVTWADWPGMHSFVKGEWDGRWILMTGRTGGLHGFLPPNPFPVTEANNKIHMLDPVSGEQWSVFTNTLPDAMSDQLRSTNAQYFQRDKYLYIIGGYGKDTLSDILITFPNLLAVDLEQLSDAIINETEIISSFRQITDTFFCVTGGEIEVLPNDEKIYLFGGHVFTGEYTKPASDAFTQAYTNELKKFKLEDDGTTIVILDAEQIKDTAIFHRRDLNFEPVVNPGEQFGLAAFAGVFQYEADWVWFNPVYINETGYAVDEKFKQKLNAYTCPVMPVYDSVSQNYYATFFGGISQFYHNEVSDTIKEDLNVPFINDISTIIKYADGSTEQILEPIKFDALLGSNAVFILNEDVPHYSNKVIQLHKIYSQTLAGYIFGGIDALVPNFTPSSASNRLFKVWIDYENPLGVNDNKQGEINIYPNPAYDQILIRNSSLYTIKTLQLINNLGVIISDKSINLLNGNTYTIYLNNLPSGIYFIKMASEEGTSIKKIIIEN